MSIYQGTSLRVDLTSHEISRGATPENGIGGRTWNSVTLLRELEPGIDPLGPENLLCISVGPLTGTEFAATCRFIASAKSPLTGFLGDSGARGFFAPELRWAGVEQIVFSGASESWKYLYIDNDQIELRDASHLVGMDITDTTVQLMDELGDPDLQVATIGPAGENLVKYAIISCNMARACGRTGMGAVMGSKKLKAIVVRGTKPTRPADPERFKKACSDLISNIEAHRQFRSRQLYGTTRIMDALADYGVLPAYHYRSAVFEDLDKVSSEALRRDHVVKGKACYNCNVYCSRYNYTSYSEGEGPEYEAQAAFTVKVGGTDLELAVHVSNLVNRLGLDCISTGEVIAWLMECRHEGIISDDDCDGIDLSWGSKEALLKLPEMIAYRKGIGDLLSEGTKRVAEKFGAEAKKLTAEVKGLELFCADPRGIKGYGLMNAVNSLVNYAEHMGLLSDSMTICKNISCCMDVVDFDLAADAYSGFLGRDITKDELWMACSHVSQVERDFNLREGLRREDDTLPVRFVDHPIPDGPAKGTTINIDHLVDDYYEVKGWKK